MRATKKPPKVPTRASRLLAAWRAANKLSQTVAAKTLGLRDTRHLYKLEHGASTAGLEVAMRIQAATGGAVPASAWLEFVEPLPARKAG